jgi:hypothetical protein
MQYFRKRQLATRYQVVTRTIDRMVRDGRLPPPDLFNGRAPLWSDTIIESNERRSTLRASPKNETRAALEGAAP